jgi:hypothetical protein
MRKMNIPPAKGTRWIYIGPGEGRRVAHTVIEVDREHVITWSDTPPAEHVGGWSWMGESKEFLRCFTPILPTTQPTP